MVNPIAAVIFDCDGTLVDSEPIENRVFAAMLTDWGYPIGAEESRRRFRGTKKDDVLRQIEAQTGRTLDREAFIAQWRVRSEQDFARQLVPIDGAHDMLDTLTIPYCIASNGPVSKMDLSLQVTGLAPFFQGRIFSAYDLGVWKPAPDLFLHAAQQMGVDPSLCLVVEDSDPGVQAGLAAGMTVLALQPDPSEPDLSDRAIRINALSQITRFLDT